MDQGWEHNVLSNIETGLQTLKQFLVEDERITEDLQVKYRELQKTDTKNVDTDLTQNFTQIHSAAFMLYFHNNHTECYLTEIGFRR